MESLIKRAATDLVNSHYAIALTGAGISTESGIPDFRGPSGIWTKDPEAEKRAYQSYHKFLENPGEYWETRLSQPHLLGNLDSIKPNPGHYALAELEKMGILKCVITQNVDGLHEKAGSQRLLEYHGNAFKLRCPSCGLRFKREEYDLEKLKQEGQLPPRCHNCQSPIKGDTVHFQEPIPSDVAHASLEEARKCDLMLICGTSAVVYPFAQLPRIARQRKAASEPAAKAGIYMAGKITTTIIEVNAEPTPLIMERVSDYLIQGRTAEILPRIVEQVKELAGR